jgi:hypothetical protein
VRPERWKLAAGGILVLLAAGLVAADRMLEPPAQEAPLPVAAARREGGSIDAVIDSLLVRSHVDLRTVKSWTVRTADREVLRRESRIDVPPSFLSLVFNHDLHNRVLPFGARVVATEHSREQTVTMHVRKDGLVIRTLIFRTVSDAHPTTRERNNPSHSRNQVQRRTAAPPR